MTAIQPGTVARALGIATQFLATRPRSLVNIPQRVAVIGQGNTASTYATTKSQETSASAVGAKYGFGSPLHLAALQLQPANNTGLGSIPVTYYPLEDDVSGVAAAWTITPTVAQTRTAQYQVNVAGILSAFFVIQVGDSVADVTAAITTALASALNVPVTAVDGGTESTLTAKWAGTSTDGIKISIEGPTDAGTTFAIAQTVSGAVNPSIAAALAQMGEVHETIVLNCFEETDTTTLDALATFNEGRWDPLVHKPFVAVHGAVPADVATAITIPDARKTDRTNVQIPAPGAPDALQLTIAAAAVARIASVANEDPALDFGRQQLPGIEPGPDGDQWGFSDRDLAIKGGSSTTDVLNGVIRLSSVITYYHPDGEDPPGYRWVKDFMVIINILYNLDLIFESDKWAGAPIVPDIQPITNKNVRKPKDAKADANGLIRQLGNAGQLVDIEESQQLTTADFDSGNQNRLNVDMSLKVRGNAIQRALNLNYAFKFGG